MAWSGPDEDLLRKLVSEGLSSSQIAKRLGKTREAVCGKAWRFGLSLRGMGATGPAVIKVRRIRAAANRKRKDKGEGRKQRPWEPLPVTTSKAQGYIARLRPDHFVPQVFPPAAEHQRKTVETLEETSCRWPIGDPQHADFHFCGAEKVEGLPYCGAHCAHAFVSPAARRREYHNGPTLELTAQPVSACETEDA